MDDKTRKIYDEAVRSKESGDLTTAKNILQALHLKNPKSPAILAVLADTCWELNQLNEAIIYFSMATNLRPKLEAVSLGLFHCLWESDREEEAIDEIKRFLSEATSEQYEQLLKDLTED